MGPLEFFYHLGYSYVKHQGLKRRKRLPRVVISIGNLTVGGTGKTPAVIALAREAKKRGRQPCVLTRGYKGKAAGPCVVSKGSGPLLGVEEAGDEAFLMAEKLKDIPVIKGNDRYEAGMFALNASIPEPSLFILDDGFQHWILDRDVDILLIDRTLPFGNRKLLPTGMLREPLTEMKRADVIVITKTASHIADSPGGEEDLIREIRNYNREAPLYMSSHLPLGLKTAAGQDLPLSVISEKTVFGFCGIGNPDSFKKTLAALRAQVRGFIAFRDHYSYREQDIRRIFAMAQECAADWIVTTEKDIMRLKDFPPRENLVSLEIEFTIEKDFYDRILREA
jgi:tetraacyldisaccharide 4'-kinase